VSLFILRVPAGIAQSTRDIERILAVVDTNASGGIDFEEFLQVLLPSSRHDSSNDMVAQAFSELQVT
jgi:Ca2+-binding EF-hand superfamily protein